MSPEQALQEADRHAALEELYAILADEAYASDYDPDAPFSPTDSTVGQAANGIDGW